MVGLRARASPAAGARLSVHASSLKGVVTPLNSPSPGGVPLGAGKLLTAIHRSVIGCKARSVFLMQVPFVFLQSGRRSAQSSSSSPTGPAQGSVQGRLTTRRDCSWSCKTLLRARRWCGSTQSASPARRAHQTAGLDKSRSGSVKAPWSAPRRQGGTTARVQPSVYRVQHPCFCRSPCRSQVPPFANPRGNYSA